MAKQPKPLDKMTKAQLVVAIKKAYKRIAKLEYAEDMRAITDKQIAQSEVVEDLHDVAAFNAPTVELVTGEMQSWQGEVDKIVQDASFGKFPWQQVLNDTKGL